MWGLCERVRDEDSKTTIHSSSDLRKLGPTLGEGAPRTSGLEAAYVMPQADAQGHLERGDSDVSAPSILHIETKGKEEDALEHALEGQHRPLTRCEVSIVTQYE